MMRNIFGLAAAVAVVCLLGGCQDGQLLTVDFKTGQQLEYKIVSARTITLDIGGEDAKGKKSKDQSMIERLEMVICYSPTGAEDQLGRTTVNAVCKSANVRRTSFTGKSTPKDPVESLAGKSFKLTLSATGQIEDASDLQRVLNEIGKLALSGASGSKKVKIPDMITDFAGSQWYLWDATSKVTDPAKGVSQGQSWSTYQIAPMPIPMNIVKKATYTLAEISEEQGDMIAIIDSSFEPANKRIQHWADPYNERYYMKGVFAFLQGYDLVSLEGNGRQYFNISKGCIQKEDQQYRMVFNVAFPLALGDTVPQLVIDQKFSVELLSSR